ncbi:hypothetical protein IEQ34_019568 [Dendrobium chrysotoxum]|uniref:Uncharacterized protein n=1 Tax=Dendrobium chrysotoxum TaxID=161865 RepID=A0AAV7G947_DENCH|nr:hypothetical protein IEQ34_019568 [Dendrobium chrysotoxum]
MRVRVGALWRRRKVQFFTSLIPVVSEGLREHVVVIGAASLDVEVNTVKNGGAQRAGGGSAAEEIVP